MNDSSRKRALNYLSGKTSIYDKGVDARILAATAEHDL